MRTAMAQLVVLLVGARAGAARESEISFPLNGNELKGGLDSWRNLSLRSDNVPVEERLKGTLVFGYLLGVVDLLQETGVSCAPTVATRGQVADVVSKFLSDHPAQRHLSAASLIMAALTQAFPCVKAKAP